MADTIGIKDTKEAIFALAALGKFVADRLKDGADFDDLLALITKLNDAEFRTKLDAGIEGLKNIPDEVSDLSFIEILELAKVIPDVLKELKST